jgi:hypothetical protein
MLCFACGWAGALQHAVGGTLNWQLHLENRILTPRNKEKTSESETQASNPFLSVLSVLTLVPLGEMNPGARRRRAGQSLKSKHSSLGDLWRPCLEIFGEMPLPYYYLL